MDFKSYSQGYHPQGFRIHFNRQGKQRLRSNRYVCMTLRGGRPPSCCVGALKPFHSMVNGDIWICSHLVISTCQLVSSSWSLFISQIPPLMRDVLYLTAVLNRSDILYTVLNRNMNIEWIHTLSILSIYSLLTGVIVTAASTRSFMGSTTSPRETFGRDGLQPWGEVFTNQDSVCFLVPINSRNLDKTVSTGYLSVIFPVCH